MIEEIKKKFTENYENYFPVKVLKKYNFQRFQCKVCKNFFWSLEKREHCEEPECREKVGKESYGFVSSPLGKKCSYKEAWELWKKCFSDNKHTIINRYPVVPKWRDDIFFVEASIDAFIPFVVEGIAKPPANPLLIPQFCLRFNDLENVGITGRHYSGFIMVGQHSFNTKDNYVYFMDEAIEYIIQLLTKYFEFPLEEIVFHESVWYGSASLGSSLEFFIRGLELGNQVYTLYKITDKGLEDLPTKVIDMGAGLERYAWITNGTKTSYPVVFPRVLEYLNSFDLSEEEKFKLADHTRTLFIALFDGALPSNTGGGYNLRKILRICFSILRKKNVELDLFEVIKEHSYEFSSIYPELRNKEKLETIAQILEVEKEKYNKTIEHGKKLVKKIEVFDLQTLLMLYRSHGIDAEIIKEVKPEIEIPEEYYREIEKKKKRKEEKEIEKVKSYAVDSIEETQTLYYEDLEREIAKVLKILKDEEGYWIILDRTIFFPVGAGQDCDLGFINDKKVLKVIEYNNRILHLVGEVSGLEEGDKVELILDVKRRDAIKKHHTATHILNGACKRILGHHANQAGAFKTIDKAHLDIYHFKNLSEEEKEEIEKLANQIVKEGRKIKITWMERSEAEQKYGFDIYQGGFIPSKDLRIVEIEDFDVEACSGLHCKNTSEVGNILITNIRKIADNVIRLEFKAGESAVQFLKEMDNIARECAEILNCEVENLPEKTQELFEEWKRLRKKLRHK